MMYRSKMVAMGLVVGAVLTTVTSSVATTPCRFEPFNTDAQLELVDVLVEGTSLTDLSAYEGLVVTLTTSTEEQLRLRSVGDEIHDEYYTVSP